MEWRVIFPESGYCDATKLCWAKMRTSIKHPLRPVYNGDKMMIIRDKEIHPTYQLPHLYRYWKQNIGLQFYDEDEPRLFYPNDKVKSELGYQLDRPSDFLKRLRGLFPDLTLVVGEKEFEVHRAILAATSSYFREIFRTTPSNRINLDTIDSSDFSKIIDLIYGDRVIISGLEGMRFLALIRKLRIDEISFREIEEMMSMIEIRGSPFNLEVDQMREAQGEIKEEDLLEFIKLADKIYEGEDPDWYSYFFDYITPRDKVALKKILVQLSQSLQDYFNEGYYLSDDD